MSPKWGKMVEGCRTLHNDELHTSSASSGVRLKKSWRMRLAGHVARMGEMRNAHTILLGKPEGKRPLGRLELIWEDNIRIYLRETGWGRCVLDSTGTK
jgi:hypothetical protein